MNGFSRRTFLVCLVTTLSFSTVGLAGDDGTPLGLQMLYSEHAFSAQPALGRKAGNEVGSCTEPQLNRLSDGKPCSNDPTAEAIEGLHDILRGNQAAAMAHGQWLLTHSVRRGDALLFPHQNDYASVWPYDLKAPWTSGLTQGAALGLFSYLFQATRAAPWRETAEATFRSYLLSESDGGFAIHDSQGAIFEEYPTKPPTHVLSGAAIAALALHDYGRIFGDGVALELFAEAARWFDSNIDKYTVVSRDYPAILSRYSLQRQRPEVLFRLIGPASAKVFAIELREKDQVLTRLNPGDDNDDRVTNPSFVWDDPDYQNWGSKGKDDTGSFRTINPGQGKYDQAPFTIPIDFAASVRLVLQVAITSGQPLELQFYDGNKYVSLGRLEPTSIQPETFSFSLQNEFFRSALAVAASKPAIVPSYFGKNYEAMKIVGFLSGFEKIQRTASLWQASEELIPFKATTERPSDMIGSEKSVLDLIPNSQESIHVEYPAVVAAPDRTPLLYYAAFGDDHRWRILLATSLDGVTWSRQGQLFNEAALPFSRNYAFPNVITYDVSGQRHYAMAFAAASAASETYDTLYLSFSDDGWHWSVPRLALKDASILDPLLLPTDGGGFEVFYTCRDRSTQSVMHAVSPDGAQWTSPLSVWAIRNAKGSGIYTLGSFVEDGVRIFLIEGLVAEGRHEWRAYCQATSGQFIELPGSPEHMDSAGEAGPMLYGMTFENNDKAGEIYFNHIAALGAEAAGVIHKAPIDMEAIKRLSFTPCAARRS